MCRHWNTSCKELSEDPYNPNGEKGELNMAKFDCTALNGQVLYQHFGLNLLRHQIQLKVTYQTRTENVEIPLLLNIQPMNVPYQVLKQFTALDVQGEGSQMLKTEVIDSTKFGVQYNARDTNCNVMVLQIGKWPMYGHLLDRSMKRFPSAKIPCKRFLSSGYFYTQKRITTSAILDHVPILIEISSKSNGKIVFSEYYDQIIYLM